MKKIIYTERSLESLQEISSFLKYKWTEKEMKKFNDDILKFINTLHEGIISHPKFSSKSEIRYALIAKKQVKVFFEKKKDAFEIYLFWPSKKDSKLLKDLLSK